MSDEAPTVIEPLVGVTDPSEIDRENHSWGDRLVLNFGNLVAWAFPILMMAIVAQIFLRGSGYNQAWLDDLQWWIYGFAVLTGFGYAITTNSHVRVDIFYDQFTDKKKAWTDIFGLAWLLLPFIMVMLDILFHYAVSSWLANEGSDSPNGLHGLYILKTSLPILFALAGLAAWSAYCRWLAIVREPTWANKLFYALPATWFAAERVIYYALWWFTRITQPDLNPRRIAREDIFEYTTWMGLGLTLALVVILHFVSRSKSKAARS